MVSFMLLLLITCFLAFDPHMYESISTEMKMDSKIKSIESLNEISSYLDSQDTDTLIVFDLDEVLVTTEDPFLRPELEETFLGCVKEAMTKAIAQSRQETLHCRLSDCLTNAKRYLLDVESPELIARLQNANKKVIALTNHPTGKLGSVESLQAWKAESMRSFGFHFAKSFPEMKNGALSESVLYEDGTVFCRGVGKGVALMQFLSASGYKPKKVIFIDDLMKNLDEVRQALSAHNIAFEGFYYTKAKFVVTDDDKQKVKVQFRYLSED